MQSKTVGKIVPKESTGATKDCHNVRRKTISKPTVQLHPLSATEEAEPSHKHHTNPPKICVQLNPVYIFQVVKK